MLKIEDLDNNLMKQEIRWLTDSELDVITGGLVVGSYDQTGNFHSTLGLTESQVEQIQGRLGKIYQNTGAVSR